MVFLNVKSRESNLFILEAKLDSNVDEVIKSIADIQNGRLKILRICTEIEELVRYLLLFCDNLKCLLNSNRYFCRVNNTQLCITTPSISVWFLWIGLS